MFQTLPYLEIAGLTPPRHPRPEYRASGLFARMSRRVGRWLERSRIERKLSSLDDRLLADIGLTREDIPEAARGRPLPGRPGPDVEWRRPRQIVFGIDGSRPAANDPGRKIAA